jgi:hypothetical protein
MALRCQDGIIGEPRELTEDEARAYIAAMRAKL